MIFSAIAIHRAEKGSSRRRRAVLSYGSAGTAKEPMSIGMTMKRPILLSLVFGIGLLLSAPCAFAETKTISIQKGKFDPKEIAIKVGDTLVWQNDDDSDHTVAAGDQSFASGTLKHGEHYEHTFSAAGTFTIADRLHPRLKETVTVK
jgi:plastocyanin